MEDTKTVLVITPHPDDAESGAGGTIAKFVKEGRKVVLVVCTNGDKGTSDKNILPQDLAKTREIEQLEAAKVLGISEVVFLGYPDQGLEDTAEFRGKIVKLIRKHRPYTVMAMDPNRKYIRHRDHIMSGRVTLDAIFPYARDHLSYPELLDEGLEPHKVQEVLLWGTDEPDLFLDVTDTFEIKRKALYCHISQVGHPTEERENRARERFGNIGKKIGVPLAEEFKRVEIFR